MMEQNSPTRWAHLRLACWLMAGASTVAMGGASQAETVSPFWVLPAVLSDATKRPALPPSSLQVRPQPSVTESLAGAGGSMLRLRPLLPEPGGLRAADVTPFISRLAAGSVEFQPLLSAQIGRLAIGKGLSGLMSPPAQGFDAEAPGGKLRLTTYFLEDDPEASQRDFRSPDGRDKPRDLRGRDISRRHRLAAQLIDSGNLRLLVDGEMGHLSEGQSATLLPLMNGRFVLPGSWSSVSSRLEYGNTNVTVGFQDYETRESVRSREQITVGFKASELQVYRRQASEFSMINGGQWLRRTTFSGVSADLLVADVLPGAVLDMVDHVRHILPTSVNGSFERGDVTRAELTVGPRDKVSTANLALTWRGRFGDTTASVWERRVSTDMIMPGAEDGVNLSRSSDRYSDISHSMSRGNWKFGAGLSLIQTNDEMLGIARSERQVAPHVSVGYAPERGPKLELRYGAADAQSQLVDDDLAARAKARQLQLSIDVSDYVRESLNRPEANLRLEYRYDFGKSEESRDNSGRDQEGGHALLVTFSTPLN
jgi:hypothetical protein